MTRENRDSLTRALGKLKSPAPVRWRTAPVLTDYETARAVMRETSARIAAGKERELVWLVEHPPLYTAGTSARPSDLLEPERFPVHQTGRGGQYTYHGPGQRVAYAMLDLRARGRDVRAYVTGLEEWIIATLAALGVTGERREDRVGVWVRRPDKGAGAEDKIAAIGVRVSRWVTRHGIAINARPDLEHFSSIVPCGVTGHGVTSLQDLGAPNALPVLDAALKDNFQRIFAPEED